MWAWLQLMSLESSRLKPKLEDPGGSTENKKTTLMTSDLVDEVTMTPPIFGLLSHGPAGSPIIQLHLQHDCFSSDHRPKQQEVRGSSRARRHGDQQPQQTHR